MTTHVRATGRWMKLPIVLRAIISGLLIALPAANVWPLLVLNVGVPFATIAESIFLAGYVWWVAGGGPRRATQTARATCFRRGRLSPTQWSWGVIAAIFLSDDGIPAGL
jgi:hypothetical protein